MDKIKIELEYQLTCTPISLFRALATPSGLSDWFADHVDIFEKKVIFYWDKSPSIANIISSKENDFVRFKWEDDDKYYFEFRIIVDELTGDISLIVTDFTEPSECDDTIDLWNIQIEKLKSSIGCAKK